ncbi:hypothetical protein [Pandoravirus japonicus]|uniref:Transmembrane protein n=1 Tax=Pandoravirus japonicus TaxID=2823154 RepID=A0A811BQI9_9VIRU|nr:hypothetical protein [Pandoravirus japonicus]
MSPRSTEARHSAGAQFFLFPKKIFLMPPSVVPLCFSLFVLFVVLFALMAVSRLFSLFFFIPMVVFGVVFFFKSQEATKKWADGTVGAVWVASVFACARAQSDERPFAARKLSVLGAPFGRAWANEGALENGTQSPFAAHYGASKQDPKSRR